jgi:predicted outer membrane repeat protein
MAVFEFDPPVTAFHTYYASLAVGKVGTMKLFQDGVLQAILASAPSPDNVAATGHGFDAWFTPIDRIEITTNDTTGTVLGAFGGLAANEPSLGTTTINNYNGPGSSQTIQLDFACAFEMTAQVVRVVNTTQQIGHWCIRDAIGWANNGDVLVVNPSVYHEAIDLQGKNVTVVSANPDDPGVVEQTVINAGDNDWSAVRTVSGEGPNAQLIGLTIANGRGTLEGGERRGGGLYMMNSSPTIDRCRFLANNSGQPNGFIGRGGAIYVGDNSVPAIEECIFTANSSYNGGAIYAKAGGWNISDCEFVGNTAALRGAGISIAANVGPSAVGIANCAFHGNTSSSQGGAISAFNLAGTPGGNFLVIDIDDSLFLNNTAGSGSSGGAIWSSGARLDIASCDFVSNSASNGSGGAISMVGQEFSTPNVIRDCRFQRNTASPGDSGGIVAVSSTGPGGFPVSIKQCLFLGNHGVSVLGGGNESTTTVTSCTFAGNGPDASVHANISPVYLSNSIIWDDVIPSVSDSFEGDVYMSYCNVKEGSGSGGVGNLHVDPRFVDALGNDGLPGTGDEDLRLMPDSPCVNTGLGTHDPRNPEFDFDGVPRHQGAIDMGAYEFELDCNSNSVPDHVEIAQGQLSDCNDNLQWDVCETGLDGNCNDVPDLCEILNGTLHDTNSNSIPDEFEVGGVISGGVVWSVSNGPCIRVVTQDITVAGSLTVQEGVQIRMMPGVKWTVLSGGSLVVAGSEANPVEFTSNKANPVAGDWDGIRYNSGSNGSFSHAIIQYTLGHGIRIESAPVSVTDCVIADVRGINQPQGTPSTPAQVGGAAYGIYVSGNVSPTLARNVIQNVRGGTGGRGKFAVGGEDGDYGNAATAWGGNGGNGDNATTNGSTGAPGALGGDAYGIFCGVQTNASIRDNEVRLIAGGDGGVGGDGGMGGWGGDGGAGKQSNIMVWPPVCTGGDGGNGGNATNGGNGAAGGNGASAFGIRVLTASGASIHQNLVAHVTGGAGAEGGSGGLGGYGGIGGDGAPGNDGVVCGEGPGTGGEGGDGGDGGNGGAGGQGGKAFGISVGTTPQVVVSMSQNTIAEIEYGALGPAGSSGPAGPGGAGGSGAWGLLYVEGLPIPIPIFGGDGSPGVGGVDGLPGVAGGHGDLTGLRAEGSAIVTLANSILTSENPTSSVGVTAVGSASLTLSYTLMSGFQTPFGPNTTNQGLGNLLLDPVFVDQDAGDFHLLSLSPAIDAGNNASIPLGLVDDLDGLDRLFDGNGDRVQMVDLGAYEWQPTVNPCPGDVTGNSFVDVDDLLAVVNSWGPCGNCAADITGNGVVDVDDLLAVINGWGTCQ